MMIERLGGIDPLKNVQGSQKAQSKQPVSQGSDTIEFSFQARQIAEAYRITKIAAETPDIRADKVALAKQKIQDPNYINSAVVELVADRIMSTFGI